MNSLIHLMYASTATVGLTDADMTGLLRHARRQNESVGVTGMLLCTDGSFFQVLEGARGDVEATFAAILADPRHNGVVTLIRERIARRSFGEWSMGFASPTAEQIATEIGANDFFGQASCFDRLDNGRTKKLLLAFRNGRWRSRVDPDCAVDAVALPR